LSGNGKTKHILLRAILYFLKNAEIVCSVDKYQPFPPPS